MFTKFAATFSPDQEKVKNKEATILLPDARLDRLLQLYGGQSFNQGLYRMLPKQTVASWNGIAEQAFPAFTHRLSCFAVDWLGRIFALDSGRTEAGYPGVLLLEPGTGEALEIPCDIESFHDSELVIYREEALAESFFQQWLEQGGNPPRITQCAGYKVPLFLGGSDTPDNLAITDLDVYWHLSAQLIIKIR